MPTEQVLKKKLRGVVTTRKISKAMKTAATVKYSQLSAVYSGYSEYSKQCRKLYEDYKTDFAKVFPQSKTEAPVCYVIMASNKGMCGNFNSDVFYYAENLLSEEKNETELIFCGEKTIAYFLNRGYKSVKEYTFNDVPKFTQAKEFYDDLCDLLSQKEYSSVKIVYPRYVNMVRQYPCVEELFNPEGTGNSEEADVLFVPDKETVINKSAEKIITSMLYGFILETAIGAQAATVMSMRSAYDAAVEYEEKLEGEINRKRQSRVTADVIETFAEYFREEE